MAGYFSGNTPREKDPVIGFKALHHIFLSHGLAQKPSRGCNNRLRSASLLNLNPVILPVTFEEGSGPPPSDGYCA